MKFCLLPVIALLSLAAGAGTARAGIIFADNFDDGVVSDWTVSSNYAGVSEVAVRSDISVSSDYSLWVSLFAPPGGSDLWTRANHEFRAGTSGDFTLSLSAMSSPCQGCQISYDVLVDGTSVANTVAPSGFDTLSLTLGGLSAGSHELSLGVHTTNASSGRFSATFDSVVISDGLPDAPEPAAFLLALGGVVGLYLRRRF